jgi:hypothetical protein
MDELFSMMILALAGSVVMMVGILLGKDARQSMARALTASISWGAGYFLLLGGQVLAITNFY